MDEPCVNLFGSLISSLEIGSATRFIPHRPEDNGRMILIPFHHTYHPIDKGTFPTFPLGQHHVAMTFQISFVHHVKSIVVKQSIHLRIIRIMTGTNGVQVETLKEKNILYHAFYRHRFTETGMNIVTIGTLEQHQCIIDIHFIVTYFNFAETILLGSCLEHLAGSIQQFQIHSIQIRCFGAPELGITNTCFCRQTDLFSGSQITDRSCKRTQSFAIGIQQPYAYGGIHSRLAIVLHVCFDT